MTLVEGGLTLFLGAVDDVAGFGHGADELRAPGVALELAPQSAEPGPEYLDIVAVFGPPDPGEQLLVEHKPPRVVGQLAEQQPLGPGQVFGLAADQHLALAEIDGHIPHAEELGALVLLGGLHSAPDGFDSGHQFVGVERLGQVVVGAQLQPLDAVGVSPS